jgi:hypothetical protein
LGIENRHILTPMLILDPDTGKIFYRGREVGELVSKGGRSTVRLCLEYEASVDDSIIPLSLLATGLSQLPENRPSAPALTIETTQGDIDEEFDVPPLLLEKLVKRKNYIWDFHKADADPRPSLLHGHDCDKGLKLDALTGAIYDVATRQRCKTLKPKTLRSIQDELRASKDFKDKVIALVDEANNT